ncbi:MAG: glycosyltransferase family 4 protein [Burkholderiales bacterium]
MAFIFSALAVTFLVTLLLIRGNLARNRGQRHMLATRRAGWVRPSHLRGLGRAGGIGIAAGLLVSLLVRLGDDAPGAHEAASMGVLLLVAAAPIFCAGLVEDFLQGLSIWLRMTAAVCSATAAGLMLGAWVDRVDIEVLAPVLALPLVSILFTCFAVAGIANAFNLIDGFNGLAGGVAVLILLGIAYVAFKAGDVSILACSLTAVGAITGFMLLNYPRGLIYMGDGGAYLIGFWIAALLVLLVARNSAVSAWFPVLVCSYPIFETLFTIYRRVVIRRTHPGLPDVAHLHHLVYKRLVRWLIGTHLAAHRTQRNALTSPYLWTVAGAGVVPATLFWNNTLALQVGCAMFAVAYVVTYSRIARFRSPRWLVLRKIRDD